jgi:hypothetical protein
LQFVGTLYYIPPFRYKNVLKFNKKCVFSSIFLNLDPDPDSEHGSGSTKSSDLDPQPCFKLCKAGIKDVLTEVMSSILKYY